MNVVDRLRDTEVFDTNGDRVRLGALWQDRSIVLVFVRHFGCMFCRQQVAQLRQVVQEIRNRGAEIVVVGNGGVEQARGFREELELPFPLYTDPSLESYRRAGLRHGPGSTFSLRAALHAATAFRQGFRQNRIEGDPMQQGGAFVIAMGGRLLYEYVSREAGDHPTNRDLLSALDKESRELPTERSRAPSTSV